MPQAMLRRLMVRERTWPTLRISSGIHCDASHMQIDADPDGAGALPHTAVRYSHNPDGTLAAFENGTTTATDGSGFNSAEIISMLYDNEGRKIRTTTASTVEQISYDGAGRPLCRATRMNSAVFQFAA